MATKYNVFINAPGGNDAPVASRAKKDAAIAFGEKLGETFRVVTDSGKLVHEHVVTEPDEDLIGTPADPEPTDTAADAEKAEQEADEATSSPEATPGSKHFDIGSMKRKIAALLHKAEKTDNEAERDAFNAGAERLMLKLGVNQAELEAAGTAKAEKIIQEQLHWENVYAKNLVNFAHAVCSGIGNLTTLQSGRWASASVFIIGHKSDVELAVKLIKSLEAQAFSALKVWQKSVKAERTGMSNYDKLVGNRSFIAGFANTVSRRLAEERRSVEQEASTGAALVLADKQSKVDAAVADMYPKLGKARGGNGRYSSLAAAAGRTAGAQADLGEKRVGGKKGELS